MSSSILRLAPVSTIAGVFALSVAATVTATAQSSPVPADLIIKNATVMTASHGTIQHGSVWVHNGKIAGVGATVSAPAGATVIDATGGVRNAVRRGDEVDRAEPGGGLWAGR